MRAAQAAFAHPDVAPLAADIAAIGLTGQMQDLVPVAGARPVRPALLYSDVRAADHAAGLHAAFPDWDARTGNLQDAAAVNATRWALLNALKATGLPVETGSGGRTKFNRTRLDIPKTHALDAACVGAVDQLRQ